MKLTNYLITSFVILNSLLSYAGKKPKYITIEALKETSNELEPDAVAAVLDENTDTYYVYNQGQGFTIVTDYKRVVKIYKKDGLSYGIFKEVLGKSSSGLEETLGKIKGVTYNLQGDKIVTSVLKKDGIFTTEQSKYRNTTSISMPNVEVGSIVEISFSKFSPFNISIESLYIQERIPVLHKTASYKIPNFYKFNIQTRGENVLNMTDHISNDTYNYSYINTYTNKRETRDIDYQSKVIKINANNIKAIAKEPYVDNVWNYTSTLQFFLKSIDYPNETIRNYGYTWGDVLKKILKDPDFVQQLNKKNYFKNDLQSILENTSDYQEKVNLIFDFVKKRMRWNKDYSDKAYGGVSGAYQKKIGSSGQINMILLSMLQNAGIDARPVFITTKDRRIDLFPNYRGFNHFIVEVNNPDLTKTYLDAIHKKAKPNILTNNVRQGQAMFLSKSKKAIRLNLEPKQLSHKDIVLNYKFNESLSSISGSCKSTYKEYYAFRHRTKTKKDSTAHAESLTKKYELDDLKYVKREGLKKLNKPVKEDFGFTFSKNITWLDNEIYFNPLLFLENRANPFKQDTRKYPLQYLFPRNTRIMVIIEVPEGYKVTELPKGMKLTYPGKGSFAYNISHFGNKIQLMYDFKMNETYFSVLDYPSFKTFTDKAFHKQQEQIVLSKEL